MKIKQITIIILLLVSSLLVFKCTITDEMTQSYKAEKISVSNPNGAININGYDGDEIVVTAEKIGASKGIKVKIQKKDDLLLIDTEIKQFLPAHVNYYIKLPEETIVQVINTSSGSIEIENCKIDGKIKSQNGSVELSKLKGNLDISSQSGSVEIDEFKGDISITTSSGRIEAENIIGSINTKTQSGSIEIVKADKLISAETVSGSIEIEEIKAITKYLKTVSGSIRADFFTIEEDVNISSGTGAIRILVREEFKGFIEMKTKTGSIDIDMEDAQDFVIGDSSTEKHIKTKLNGGGKNVNISTTTGSISLEQSDSANN